MAAKDRYRSEALVRIEMNKRKSQLPEIVVEVREEANLAAAGQNAERDVLQYIDESNNIDVKKMIAVSENFYASQNIFENLIWQALDIKKFGNVRRFRTE